jgi:hypothetical protein
MLSRLQHYHPDRLSALAFLTLGYSVPGTDLNRTFVDATNRATLTAFRYPLLGYWYFNERDNAATIMDQHVSWNDIMLFLAQFSKDLTDESSILY